MSEHLLTGPPILFCEIDRVACARYRELWEQRHAAIAECERLREACNQKYMSKNVAEAECERLRAQLSACSSASILAQTARIAHLSAEVAGEKAATERWHSAYVETASEVERLRRDLFIAKKVVCRLYNVVLGVRARFSAVKLESRLEMYIKSTRREIIDDMGVPELKVNLDYYKEP